MSRHVQGFKITNNQPHSSGWWDFDWSTREGQLWLLLYLCKWSSSSSLWLPSFRILSWSAAVHSTLSIQPNMCLNQDDPTRKECRFGRWFSMPCSWLRSPQPVNWVSLCMWFFHNSFELGTHQWLNHNLKFRLNSFALGIWGVIEKTYLWWGCDTM